MLEAKKIWAMLILTIIIMTGGAFSAFASMPEAGYLDEIEGNTIIGWGWDSSMPNTAVPIHVTVTNQETGEVAGDFTQTAIIYRNDLEVGGVGNGRHGFRIAMNWDTLPDGSYLIKGDVNGQPFSNTRTYVKGDIAPAAEEAAPAIRSLGVFRTTGYCPCSSCSEGWGRKTSTGAIAQSNHTIAVDPKVIPYGSKVMINGVIYTAEDRGGGVKGNHIDIFFDTHAQTRQHGSRNVEVFLVS